MAGDFQLKAFEGLAGLTVLRGGPFALTGKLSTPLDRLCVPLKAAKYLDEVNANARVAAVITTAEIADGVSDRFAVAVAPDPVAAHSEIHARCVAAREQALRETPNVIHPEAVIEPGAHVAAYGVSIGPRTRIMTGCVVHAGVRLEADCVMHAGVVLGGPGFNVGLVEGRQRIVPQLGGVHIHDWVELLANTTVARALFGGATTIGAETVSDNGVYIAHDCQIGRRVQICANATILGRVEIGDGAYVGPAATIVNGAAIGAGAKVTMGSVVTRDVADGAVVTGNFAIDHQRFLAQLRSIR